MACCQQNKHALVAPNLRIVFFFRKKKNLKGKALPKYTI